MSSYLTRMHDVLPVQLSPAPGTPRMALAIAIDGGVRRERLPGTGKMAEQLLLKGTERRSAEVLATEIDARAIDLRVITLSDCTVVLAIFLNRELEAVLDLLEDILFHSTFADFEKEATKLTGEIQASLDLPAERAQDLLLRTLFAGYPYGHTGTRMLESLSALTADTVRAWFAAGLNPAMMNVTLVGDLTPEEILPRLGMLYRPLAASSPAPALPAFTPIDADQVVTQARPEAQQAQIYQGWYAPPVGSPQQPSVSVMNTILGAAGLSSRLFTELRDRQGLAYSVRSSYVPMRAAGQFLVSIGTSPENIDRAREGFARQIARMQDEPVSLEELQNAKGRLRGSYALTHETNSQICLDLAISQVNGLGPDYSLQMLQRIEGVTVADVQSAAQGIAAPSVTAIVAREDALPQ